jgi:DNA-binding GntR family transcriptional regulator
MKRIVIHPAVSEAVTTEIRNAIVDGTLAPGTRIKQEDLAARLHVSRAPIRQALMVLKREGLVQVRHHRGAIVSPLDLAFINDLYELREAIEGLAVARLAERHSFDPAPLWKIVADGQQAVASGDLNRIIEMDLAFHMGLYEALGNRPLISTMDAQWCHYRRAFAATLSVSSYRNQVWDEHAAILRAIVAGQPEAATAASIAHTRGARAVALQKLKELSSDQALAGHVGEKPRKRLEQAPVIGGGEAVGRA